MNKINNINRRGKLQGKDRVRKALMFFLACGLAMMSGVSLSSCSSDDDPYFTVTEDDSPRILNSNLATETTIDEGTPFQLEMIVTPVHYTTVTWWLDGEQIAEGNTIDQVLPVGDHVLKIVATTTKGKETSRTMRVIVKRIPVETTVWEGSHELTWKTPFDGMKDTMIGYCSAGTKLRLYVEGQGQCAAATKWWNGILTGKPDSERGDIQVNGSQVLEYELTDYSIELMTKQGGFLVVGNGVTLKKITIEDRVD